MEPHQKPHATDTGPGDGRPRLLVRCRFVAGPHGRGTTTGLGHLATGYGGTYPNEGAATDTYARKHGPWVVFQGSAVPMEALRQETRNGYTVLAEVAEWQIMHVSKEAQSLAVYMGPEIQVAGRAKPTLHRFQGVIVVGRNQIVTRYRQNGRGETVEESINAVPVVYDRTDWLTDESEWEEGMVITDVPSMDLMDRANWRTRIGYKMPDGTVQTE